MDRPPSIVESPWYWACWFCVAGLGACVLLGDKVANRQSQLERKFQGFEQGERIAAGEPVSNEELASPGNTRIDLRPLQVILGIGFVVSWGAIWLRGIRKRGVPETGPTPAQPGPAVDPDAASQGEPSR